MQVSSNISLLELTDVDPTTLHRRRLSVQGRPGQTVDGDKIEFEFTHAGYIVLATSYDYYDGCEHWIYVLNQDGTIIDQVEMPYVFGFAEHVKVRSTGQLEFSYFGTNDSWVLCIRERGYWDFSRAALALRMNRFLLSKRYMVIERFKGPPWVTGSAA